MNIFFGKISQKFDIVQLIEGYYTAPKESSWFGELQLGDYVYMIGCDKVQFWQAKEWGIKNDKESLIFDIINPDNPLPKCSLPMLANVSDFASL